MSGARSERSEPRSGRTGYRVARRDRRLAAVTARPGSPDVPAVRRGVRLPVPSIAAATGLAVALLVGGAAGIAAGGVLAVVVLRVVPRLEPRAVRRRRQLLETQAPAVVDLLVACLASGATVPAALAAVAAGVDEPAAGLLARVTAAQRLGAAPDAMWGTLAQEPAFAPLAAALRRSADTGAALVDGLPRLADDLRLQRRARLESAARTVGVRLTAPLALAFLPAFVLLGVVPVVAALLQSVLVLPVS